ISGGKSKLVLKSLFRAKKSPIGAPRQMILGKLLDHATSETIDQALAVYMPGPNSFTGEDVVEFHLHGSPLLVQKVLRSLFAFGIAPAQPGEFSKRAFLNGKLDLAQVEAVADLISASSERALTVASEQLHGRLSRAIETIGEPLRDVLAEVEARIDFPEEEIEAHHWEGGRSKLRKVQESLTQLLRTYSYGHYIKEGYRVLLCGRPNVGKSSLLNALVGNQRAIVTAVSGTTRDLIEESVAIKGYEFVFCDSAGLRESDNEVEKIGIELARSRIPWADLVLLIIDANDQEMDFQEVLDELLGKAKKIWAVTNKIDLNQNVVGRLVCDSKYCAQNFYVSVKSGAGLDNLKAALIEEVRAELPDWGESSGVVTNERHKECLERALTILSEILKRNLEREHSEILALDLRGSLSALEEIVGKTMTEDLLGRIFSKFCIGK
ncbi:MAG: tRNA uridine-5-carboxymethylaminomethyl(34) synthesis GTPase MnmE, partial [Bdellovibrionales bacterium]|nr:tRNA uridine-5-carboxymethylaminomethyl(34) synthesis GTPase MnmE [Bdellovibrionales bacterium]